MSPILEVDNLSVTFAGRSRLFGPTPPPVRAVNDVSFAVEPSRTFGLVGESGSGKSTIARAVLQLTPWAGGSVLLDGTPIDSFKGRELLGFRQRVQAVLQDPHSSLNPAHDVETVVGDPISRHRGVGRGAERRAMVEDLLELVGLPREFAVRSPHQLSGGQRQRVSIARALAVEPDLIVADECTSALDVSIQSQIVNLLRQLQREQGVALLFISHDLEIVRHISHDVGVMYLGSLVETGPSDGIYIEPAHPYTDMLLASVPMPDPEEQKARRHHRRRYISDAEPPSPVHLPPGCAFENRCPVAMDICKTERPQTTAAHHGGSVRCHLHTSGPQLGGTSVVDFIDSPGRAAANGDRSPRKDS